MEPAQYKKIVYDNRKSIAAVLVIILLIIALFLPVFTGVRGIFHDDQAMEEFSRMQFIARNLQNGILPLWDPYTWCGAIPVYSRYFADTYYIPMWPLYLAANVADIRNTYALLILFPLVGYYVCGALGMYMLLRHFFRLDILASFTGAILYVFNPFLMYAYSWKQVVIITAWAPVFLMLYAHAYRKFSLWLAVCAAVVMSFMITAALPNYIHFYILVWFGFIVLILFLPSRISLARRLFKSAVLVTVIVCIAAGLSAVYLFSAVDGIAHTAEHIPLTLNAALADTEGSLPFAYLATLFVPNLFDNLSGNQISTFIPSQNVLYWESNLSGGIFITFAVFLCIFLFVHFRASAGLRQASLRRFSVFGMVLYFGAVIAALGNNTPVYKYSIGLIPGINAFPRPARYHVVQCFAAALLAALGVHVMSRVPKDKLSFNLKKATVVFLILSSVVVCLAMMVPFRAGKVRSHRTIGTPGPEVEGFSDQGQAVGQFTGPEKTDRIGVFFDAPSRGQIRYADTADGLSVDGGTCAFEYRVDTGGWHEFTVHIPASRFVWIYQQQPAARIGYKRFRDIPIDGFVFTRGHAWVRQPDTDFFTIRQVCSKTRQSMFSWLSAPGPPSRHVRNVLIYFLAGAGILLVLSISGIRRPVSYIALLVCIEAFVVSAVAFYGATFTPGTPSANHIRALGPGDNVFFNRVNNSVVPMMEDPFMRIATAEPYHDNFFRLSAHYAFMGYEMHPLDRRFKAAVEKAYGQPVDYQLYYAQPRPLPDSWFLLRNFSVGYFLGITPAHLFSHDIIKPVMQAEGYFLHIDPDALSRMYFNDNVIAAAEGRQLEALVKSDLKKAVYVLPEDYASRFSQNRPTADFEDLQKMNRISGVDYSNPNRIRLLADVKNPAMLIFTEIWHPGWSAYIDGMRSKIFRVNYCQRGVWVPAGSHTISLDFCPDAWRTGAAVSIITAGIVLAFFVIKYMIYLFTKRKATT